VGIPLPGPLQRLAPGGRAAGEPALTGPVLA